MTLIVEDGSIVENANSYVSVDDARTFASLRGVTLPASDAEVEVLLIKATDFIEAQRLRFQGSKVNQDQALQWPRTGVYVDGFEVASDSIPYELRNAQILLAIEAQEANLQPNASQGIERVSIEGAIEVAFDTDSAPSQVNSFSKPQALLGVLYKRNGLTAIRT